MIQWFFDVKKNKTINNEKKTEHILVKKKKIESNNRIVPVNESLLEAPSNIQNSTHRSVHPIKFIEFAHKLFAINV